MKISIFGLGYVGAVSLACLARDGHEVIGVDVDPDKLNLIREGRTPVVEEGMVDLMASVAKSGRVSVTTDVEAAIKGSELSFICVGTPSAANGSQDQGALVRVTQAIGTALKSKAGAHLIAYRSTVVPGTVEETLSPILEAQSGKRAGEGFDVVFQPEFLREGSSIRDYDSPSFTIVGTRRPQAAELLRALFGHLPGNFFTTSVRAAETIKYCCNNFHALKITFANETARLCEALEVDAFEVMDLVCRDTRLNISPAYLKPGFAFGGSCLPKDLRATAYLAKMNDVELPLHASLLTSNRIHLDHAISKVLASGCRRVGMLGLSFKTGTDDLRESPLVSLAEYLIGKGISLRVYDPEVHLSKLLGANRRYIEDHLPHIGSLLDPNIENVIGQSDLVVVGLHDARVIESLRQYARDDQTVLDLVHIAEQNRPKGRYIGMCW